MSQIITKGLLSRKLITKGYGKVSGQGRMTITGIAKSLQVSGEEKSLRIKGSSED